MKLEEFEKKLEGTKEEKIALLEAMPFRCPGLTEEHMMRLLRHASRGHKAIGQSILKNFEDLSKTFERNDITFTKKHLNEIRKTYKRIGIRSDKVDGFMFGYSLRHELPLLV